MNIIDLISFEKEDKIAFLERKGYRTHHTTYKELKKNMLKTETYLKKKKLKKGAKIIIQAPNSVNYVTIMLACLRLGIIVIPLDLHTSKELKRKISKETSPKLTFDETNINNLEKLIKDLPENKTSPKTSKDDIAEIIYTSGTTGIPKGVVLTHENIYSNVKALTKVFKFRLKYISLLPLSHMFEQTAGLFQPLVNNSTILYPNSLRYSDIIDLIRYKKINTMISVPGILEGLKKAIELREKPISNILGWQFKIIAVGGAELPQELEDWWSKKVLLLQGYGLTETSPLISTNLPFKKRKYSLGKPLKDIEVRIKDNEIQVKGPNVMQGYYKKPEQTKETFDGEWLKTGDIGEIRGGFLYFKGRIKDIIVTREGFNIYPQDIENELNKHVKESCIIEKDNKIHAVLILKEKKDVKKIIDKVNNNLEKNQKIISWTIWEGEFPKTATGKIKRFEIKQELEKKEKAKPYSYKLDLQGTINDVLKPSKKITSKSKLTDLGMDSLKRIELISALESKFGVEIGESKLDQYTKVSDLEKLIKEQATVHKIKFRTWPLNPLIRIIKKISQKIVWYPIISIFTRTEYHGIENLDKMKPPFIITINHQSAWDPAIVAKKFKFKYAIASHPKIVFGIGVKNPFIKMWRRFYGFLAAFFYTAYPFGEEISIRESLGFTGELLDRGYSIGITPEGERTLDGKIHTFKPGIGYMALNMNVPIIPVRIEGMFHILPRGRKIPRFGKSKVIFGKPIPPESFKNLSYIEAAKLIEKKVKELK